MRRPILLFACLVLFTSRLVYARDGFVTILVPISAHDPISGAYGTVWQTELWIHNSLDRAVRLHCAVTGIHDGGPTCSPLYPPGTTQRVFEGGGMTSPQAADVFNTPADVASGVTLSARLFELSRHTQPAGVHVPVVREGEFFTRPVRFVGIQRDASSRVGIRVYDPRRRPGGSVRLELFSSANALIDAAVMPLMYTTIDSEPGYAAILDLAAAFPRLNAIDRFDIQITPLTTGLEYWALASVTDRDTQQVLFVTAD